MSEFLLADVPAGEHTVLLTGPEGVLEATIMRPSPDVAKPMTIVCCHPHPQHGGTMTNKVIHTVARTFLRQGFTAIRFNFRGVGQSQGCFDNAVGEVDDCHAVIEQAMQAWPQHKLWLAGFSFGAYIAAAAAAKWPVEQLISVAPAVQKYSFEALPKLSCPWLVVQGDADEVVPAEQVFSWAQAQPTRQLVKMPGAGHFFHGRLTELANILLDHTHIEPFTC